MSLDPGDQRAAPGAEAGLPRDPIAMAAAVTIRPAAPPLLTPALPYPTHPSTQARGRASPPYRGPRHPRRLSGFRALR